MMLLKSKNIVGLILCTLILSASVPMLMGIQNTPQTIFGGDMVAVTQVNSSTKLNVSMLDTIKSEPNVVSASAEITCFSVVNDQPVLIRGVKLNDFLALEGGELVRGSVGNPERFAVIGSTLASKIGLDVGDRLLLTGSSNPALFQLEIDAVYSGRYSEDELLVSLPHARKMAGLGQDAVLFIRVKTTNQTALVETLEQQEQAVVVTTPGGIVTPVNTEITDEERAQQQLAIRYLDTAQFKATNGSYVSIFVQEGSNSIRVVVTTFIILDGALAFIGSAAIISRAVIERRHEIGIISAVGADRNYLRKLIMRDAFVMSIVSSLLGLGIGYLILIFIEDRGLLRMFGESIHPMINAQILLGMFVASVLIHMASALMIEKMLSRVKPRELMQETEKLDREVDAPPLNIVLGMDA
ncbi:MAG: FtsX-like permease family protein [Euryarchaeota archaeon]|nr:FtsX-like permease family protein [Euryarchaeota archaeon]MBU4032083.1 FtsX-like permease family protein [Candidatus Thermoplasmatota archaeon]MBU4072305.1 FtsX-like permease family protein [Candidatus Thermoplasmatota archaeon]MBU4143847.1 FtsX-like permease family protein [Candidatus Thermoplasmatota archaeon]